MDLKSHIASRGGSATPGCPVVAELAEAAQCAPTTLYMIVLGHKSAGPKLARRLATATGESVSVGELRPDIFGPVAEAANQEPFKGAA